MLSGSMDLYIFSLVLGLVGLAAMAVTGLGRHGSGGHGSHGGHGSAGHAGGHGHGGGGHHAPGHATHGHQGGVSGGVGLRVAGWLLMSPRILFAALVGFGVSGIVLRSWLGGLVLLLGALGGALLFERLVVAPLWKFALRFASNPALTLESALTADATAVTSFDQNGQGIVSIEIDGQIQQILATLMPAERARGAVVHSGQLVRIEEVDAARHRCRVSVL
jgi:hypothetical protein